MPDSPETQSTQRPPRRPRAWWQWALGVGLLAVAVLLLAARYLPVLFPTTFFAARSQRLRLPSELRASETVPAARGALAGCNLLLVTMDTTRADALACYGNRRIETPTADRLAREGVLFSQVVAPAPATLPSHASMMTGLYPYRHGARANALFRLADEHTTLAEILSAHGYATGAVISAYVLDSRFGTAQGFDHYDDDVGEGSPEALIDIAERPADATTARAIVWLRERTGERFFLWVHYFDPHSRYEPPSPYAEQYERFPYAGEVAFVDAQLGKLIEALDELDLTEQTLVVVAGDHGEGLGQHEEGTHGTMLYDSTLWVPLVMRCGGRLGGGVHVDRPASLVDVLPTALGLLGIDAPGAIDGVDLARPAGGEQRPLFTETLEGFIEYGYAALLGVRVGSMKYIHGPDPELYDLSEDWLEQKNLVSARPKVAGQMKKRLAEFFGDDLGQAVSVSPTEELSDEDRAKLAALGYVFERGVGEGGSMPAPPDPKTMSRVSSDVEAVIAAEDLTPDERVSRLAAIAREHPDLYIVHRYLGQCCYEKGDMEQAEAEFLRCSELSANKPLPLFYLARIKRQQQDLEAAVEYYRQVLRLVPDNFNAVGELGQVLLAQKHYEEAAEQLGRALALRPTEQGLLGVQLSTALEAAGRTEEAVEPLRKALAANPQALAVRSRLAELLKELGRYEEAVVVLREGLKLHPGKLELGANLALVLVQCEDARDYAKREAASIMLRICEETEYKHAGYLRALGAVYAQAGRFGEAIDAADKAFRIASEAGQTDLAEAVERELTSYRQLKRQADAAMAQTQPAQASEPLDTKAGSDKDGGAGDGGPE